MIDRDKYRALFVEEAREHLSAMDRGLVALEDRPDAETLDGLYRAAHSLKGAAGTLGYDDIASLAHAFEDGLDVLRDRPDHAEVLVPVLLPAADALEEAVDQIDQGGEPAGLDAHTRRVRDAIPGRTGEGSSSPSRPAPADTDAEGPEAVPPPTGGRHDAPDGAEGGNGAPGASPATHGGAGARLVRTGSSVRVPVDRIDRLVDLMGELRIAGTRLDDVLGEVLDEERPYQLQESLRSLHVGMRALYDDVLEIRTMPVALLLDRLPRMARDLAQELGKEAEVVLEGRETTVDRSVIEALGDPVLHLVRNALDHGIESPEVRRGAGKPPYGTLTVRVLRDTSGITVTVEDDGRGIDVEAVRERAVERGLIGPEEAAHLHADDVLRLITAPGFSTAREVTSVSGRGVGLDVVKHAVERVGGSLRLRGRPAGGTIVTLRLPPSLAVMDALAVKVDEETFYLPVDSVVTSLVLDRSDRARGRLVPPRTGDDGAEADAALEGPARLLWTQTARDAPTDDVDEPADAPIPIVRLSDLLAVRDRPRYRGSSVARSEGLRKVEEQAALSRRHGRDRHGPRPAVPTRAPISETRATEEASVAVVVKRHGQRLCLLVDAIGTLREIVVKTLDSPGASMLHVSGATIDADGSVALILDVASLLETAFRP